ncbi:unknown protein [Seminavis robusta]|uniref:Uncharacterized protein n=1 Tax=Seminavis robusta TaxID=568900 RepID=A0A9N8HNW4_9STRA|nr:unknown protein [Seminavis robusta]|eukprot:Sro1019_g231930.1 n/a (273) ;mRNA; r:3051-3869
MLKQQVHLITRDGRHLQVEVSDYKPHPDFPFALSCKVHCPRIFRKNDNALTKSSLGRWIPTFVLCSDWRLHGGVLHYGYGAAVGKMHSSLLPKAILIWLPSTARSLPQHSQAVFLSAPFLLLRSSLLVFLGVKHSEVCCNSGRGMGATADEVDIRGRWKARLSGRVVDAYISPEQPWIDARVAEKLCMGAPIAYKLHPDAKRVTPDWLIEHVCQGRMRFTTVSTTFRFTWLRSFVAALDESWEERMELPVRVRIPDAYERIKAMFLLASNLW